MRVSLVFSVVASLLLLPNPPAGAQDTPDNTNLFRLNFRGTCRSLSTTGDRLVTTRLTDKDLITLAFDLDSTDRASLRDYSLVYNASADSIQAVNLSTGQAVDVLLLDGGVAISDGRTMERFAFLFAPGRETSIGSVVITERAARSTNNSSNDRASISGRFQFALSDATGAANNGTGQGGLFRMNSSALNTDTTAEICTGTFATSRRLVFGDTEAGTTGTRTNLGLASGGTGGTTGGTTVRGTTSGRTIVVTPSGPGTVFVTPVSPGLNAGAGGVFAPVTPVTPGSTAGTSGVFVPVFPTGGGLQDDFTTGSGTISGSSFGTSSGSGSSFITSFGSGTGTGTSIGSGSFSTRSPGTFGATGTFDSTGPFFNPSSGVLGGTGASVTSGSGQNAF